jgi:hypothetical protein
MLRVAACALLLPLLAPAWVHPGVLVTAPQLAAVKTAVAAGEQPFAAAFLHLQASAYASPAWVLQGPPPSLVIDCGGYDHPDHGCTAEDEDAVAAYTQALLFYLTGLPAHAAAAARIMDAYSAVRAYTNSNAPLQAAWSASKWARAAELVQHSAFAWPGAPAFAAFLTRAALPLLQNGTNANGNWELSMVEGLLGIAVLTEDAPLLARAAAFWQSRIPAYFYYSREDGHRPVPLPHRPGGQGPPNTQGWYGQATFNASTDGLCQELCRDMEHTQMGLAAAMNAADTARIQGLDLLGAQRGRLSAALEFHANLLLGAAAPAFVCKEGRVVDQGVTYPTFEVAYRALHGGLGIDLPRTLEHLQRNVRPMALPVNRWMMAWETLTHGSSP